MSIESLNKSRAGASGHSLRYEPDTADRLQRAIK